MVGYGLVSSSMVNGLGVLSAETGVDGRETAVGNKLFLKPGEDPDETHSRGVGMPPPGGEGGLEGLKTKGKISRTFSEESKNPGRTPP